MKTLRLSLLASFAGTLACSGESSVDIGESAMSGAELRHYAASWDGYAEAYQFESGSDRVRFTLSAEGEGTLELGEAPPIPPPTDADVPYPIAVTDEQWPMDFARGSEVKLFEGYPYPVVDARVENRRIRFGIDQYALYAPWCRLQTPHPDPDAFTGYSCIPAGGWTFDIVATGIGCFNAGDLENSVGCSRAELCMSACSCTESGCDAFDESVQPALDAALEDDGASLVGTFMLNASATLRMTRDR